MELGNSEFCEIEKLLKGMKNKDFAHVLYTLLPIWAKFSEGDARKHLFSDCEVCTVDAVKAMH
jgi:hypothetical protein